MLLWLVILLCSPHRAMASGDFTIITKNKGGGTSTTSITPPSGKYGTSLGAAALVTVDNSHIALYRNAKARDENLFWIQIARAGDSMTINEPGMPKELQAKKKKPKKAAGEGEAAKKPKKRKAEGDTGKEKAKKKLKVAAH